MTLSRNGQYLAIAIRVCSLIPMSPCNSIHIPFQNDTLMLIMRCFVSIAMRTIGLGRGMQSAANPNLQLQDSDLFASTGGRYISERHLCDPPLVLWLSERDSCVGIREWHCTFLGSGDGRVDHDPGGAFKALWVDGCSPPFARAYGLLQ